MNKSSIALAIALSCSANIVNAETKSTASSDSENLETITVTATRAADHINKPLASQIVIDRADIELAQVESLPELLSRYAGIDFAQNGARGQVSTVFLRGASSDQTLLLINGLRVNSATNGGATWSTISPQLIERIEIVKGPRAAVWGSDAIGGVINIITRKTVPGEVDLSARWGTNNTQSFLVSGGVKHGDGSTTISVNHESSDGFDTFKALEDDDDGYDNLSFAINGSQKLSDDLSVSWLLRSSDQDAEYDTAFDLGVPTDMEAENENREWQLSAQYNWGLSSAKNQTTQLMLGSSKDSSFNVNRANANDPGSLFETTRDQLSLINTSEITNGFTLVVGADIYDEKVNSTTTFAVQVDADTAIAIDERRVEGYFAHGLYDTNKLSAELAVRYDDVENVDSETTYNASLAYQLTDSFRITYLKGTGFKAPTFNDLYFPTTPFSGGNPNLVSETSEADEVVFNIATGNLTIDIAWFKNDIENLIDWAADENFFFQPSNVAEADIEGVELTATYDGLGGTHSVNIGYLDAVDRATGARLARRAQNQHGYQFATSFGQTDLLVNYEYRGGSFDRGLELDSANLVDVTLDHDFTPDLSGILKLQNLFNDSYETVSGYHVIGRAAYVGVTYQL